MINIKKIHLHDIFMYQLIILLVVAQLQISSYILLGVIALTVTLFFISEFKLRLTTNSLPIIIVFCCLIIDMYFRHSSMIITLLIILLSVSLSTNELIKIYGISQVITFVYTAGLAFLGIRQLYDGQGYFFEFGFRQKNLAGYYIFVISFLIFHFLKNKGVLKNLTALLILFFVEYFLIKDRTASYLIVLYFIIFEYRLIPKNKISMTLISSLPVVLTFFSLFLAENISRYAWISRFDYILTSRIQLWAYYISSYKILWLPQNITASFHSMYGSIPFDNAYLYYLLNEGLFQYCLIIALVVYALYLACKNEDIFIFSMLFTLVLYNFTEMIGFDAKSSILLPLSFLLLIQRNNKILSNERKVFD
ncbi:hypothetical protein IMAU30120_01515 [Lactobacillus helveticus]|nr:hypothetical protein [Lactobacillus helveticus]